jgi:phasin family protein
MHKKVLDTFQIHFYSPFKRYVAAHNIQILLNPTGRKNMTDINETIESMNAMGTNAYDNLRKLGEMQMNTWNKMFEKQVETFNMVMANVVSQAELASEAKDYSEVVKGQMALNQKLGEDLIEKTRETAEFVQQTGEEYRVWAEEVVKDASDKFTAAAKKAA